MISPVRVRIVYQICMQNLDYKMFEVYVQNYMRLREPHSVNLRCMAHTRVRCATIRHHGAHDTVVRPVHAGRAGVMRVCLMTARVRAAQRAQPRILVICMHAKIVRTLSNS